MNLKELKKTKYKYYITSILCSMILFSCRSSYNLETKYSFNKCNEGIWELSNEEKEILKNNNDKSYYYFNHEKNNNVSYLFKIDSIYYCFYYKDMERHGSIDFFQNFLLIYNYKNKKLVKYGTITIDEIFGICLYETNHFYYFHVRINGNEEYWGDLIAPYCTGVIVINKENPYNANIIRFSNEKVSKIYELKENLYIETAELEYDPSLIG